MSHTVAEIINDINAYMLKSGILNKDWYVGIACDINKRLFGDHQVPEDHWWIYRRAESHSVARLIEKAYLDAGCDGGPGGGDDTTVYVYAFAKNHLTKR